MVSKTDEELIKIAYDIFHGKIFTDKHIDSRDRTLLLNIFTPLSLMNKEDIEIFLSQKPGMIYEYLSESMSMYVDGYPCFASFNYLNEIDAEKIRKLMIKLIGENLTLSESMRNYLNEIAGDLYEK